MNKKVFFLLWRDFNYDKLLLIKKEKKINHALTKTQNKEQNTKIQLEIFKQKVHDVNEAKELEVWF